MARNNPGITAAPPASATFSAMTADMTADSAFFDQAHNATDGISHHSPNSAAMISGLACGTFVLVLLACGMCWFIRNRNTPRCCSRRAKKTSRGIHMSDHVKSLDNTPSSQASEWEVLREYRPPPLPSKTRTREDLARSESQNWTRHDLRKDSRSIAPHSVVNAGLGQRVGMREIRESEQAKYTCLNPEPTSATTAGRQMGVGSVPPRALVEAPSQSPTATPHPQSQFHAKGHPDLDRSLPASPSISSMPMPITPATQFTTSPTSTTTGAQTPSDQGHYYEQQYEHEQAYTPSIYQPYPPTSLPRPRPLRAPPGHLAQTYSTPYAAPFSSHSTITSLPSSPPPLPTNTNFITHRNTTNPLAQAPPPPSLPQPYSTVSLGSTAEIYRSPNINLNLTNTNNNDLYRGLSVRGSPQKSGSPQKEGGNGTGEVQAQGQREKPPWDYLSAEEARGGGWKNRDSTGAVSGWETIGEEDETVAGK